METKTKDKGIDGLNNISSIVIALVVMVVTGAIGIYIANTVVTETGTPTDSNLSNAQGKILQTFETGAGFLVILVIAFIGGVALMYIRTFT